MLDYCRDFQGVILTHKNLISTSTCIMFLVEFQPEDVYIGT
jgi:hypothetical protein